MTTTPPEQLTWHRVLSPDELPEGRVKTVSADRSHLDDALAAGVAHDGPALIEVLTDPDLI